MALPPGISTGTVTFGQAVSLIGGGDTSMFIEIKPTHNLVHSATGIQLLDFTESKTLEEGVPGAITLPHTDQDGFIDSEGNAFKGWAYVATGAWRRGSETRTFTKRFQLLLGQASIDLDLLPNGTITIPVTAPILPVTSFLGKTGPIEEEDLADLELGGGVADEGVTTAKLAPNAVTTDKIAPGAVGGPELDNAAVTVSKIGADAVTGVKIASDAVSRSKLAPAVRTELDGLLTKTDAANSYAPLSQASKAIIVDNYKEAGDPDDTMSWRRAVAAAISTGRKLILAQSPTYTCAQAVDLTGLSGVTIKGLGMYSTVIKVTGGAQPLNAFFYNQGSVSNVEFCDFTIEGTVVDDVSEVIPRRSRTNTGGAGMNAAILLRGDRPGLTGFGTVRDITIRRMRFVKTNMLPFVFDGVKGFSAAYDVECYLTMDGSWLFCDHVVFDSIRSRKSADNGFSISRSNKMVTGGSVHVSGCFDYGIFASGFYVDGNVNDAGPKDFSIDTVNVINAGQGGIKLDDGPQNGRLGNVYVNRVYRGGSDIPTDSGGIGILIGGNPATPTRAASPTQFASAITVENALLIDCYRGGVLLSGGAKDVILNNISIFDAGSQFLADGTTAVTTGDRNNNFGVAVAQGFEGSVSNIWARSVRVVDRRATKYTNRAIDLAAAATSGYSGLSQSGCRVSVADDTATESIGGVKSFRKRIVSAVTAVTGVFPASATADAASAGSNGADDMAGTVNITTKAAAPAGVLATITFGDTYSATPHVVITPTNAASAACQPYITRSATQFQIAAGVAPAASANLSFDYHVYS